VAADGLAEPVFHAGFVPEREDGFFPAQTEPSGSVRQPTDLKSGRRIWLQGR